MNEIVGLTQLLLVGLLLAFLWSVAWTIWRLTHPPRRTYASALSRGRPGDPSELAAAPGGDRRTFTSWSLRTGDGLDLPVWEMPGNDPAGPVLILTHGWGDSRIGALTRVQPLLRIVSRAVMWDLRGHGDAPGTSRLGTREVDDLCALIAQVTGGRTEQEAHVGENAFSSERIVLFGWSLGAGVSIGAAAREPRGVVQVIAEAPYRIAITPARNVLRGMGLPKGFSTRVAFWLLGLDFGVGPSWRGFDRAALASRLRVPLLVIHGDMDDVCPVEDARAINEAAASGEIIEVRGAGHHSLWTTPTMTDQFLARVLATLQSGSADASSEDLSRD
jgi:pimeloyl-ACP methyl ester carboxylesterase